MRAFIVLLSLAALASADVKHLDSAYHYPKPSADQVLIPQTSNNVQTTTTQQIHSVPLTQTTGFGTASSTLSGQQYNKGVSTGTFFNGQAGNNGAFRGASSTSFSGSNFNQAGSSAANNFNTFGSSSAGNNVNVHYETKVVKQTAPLVSKSSYVFSAPEDDENVAHDQTIVLPRPKQHYKVVFISAPATTLVNYPSAAVGGQTQEKTLVYVLTGKQTINHKLDVPELEEGKVQKPEVFFVAHNAPTQVVNSQIKYETVDSVPGAEYGSVDGVANKVSGNGQIQEDTVSTPEQNQIAQTIYQALQTGGIDSGVRTVDQLIAAGQTVTIGNSVGGASAYDTNHFVQTPIGGTYQTQQTQDFVQTKVPTVQYETTQTQIVQKPIGGTFQTQEFVQTPTLSLGEAASQVSTTVTEQGYHY